MPNYSRTFSSRSKQRRARIVVVGAGMAGLSTARELTNLFMAHPNTPTPEIIVLEGRSRVGGRVNSYPIDLSEFPDLIENRSETVPRVDLGKFNLHTSLSLDSYSNSSRGSNNYWI